MTEFFNFVGNTLFALLFLAMFILYFRNMYKVFVAVKTENYGLLTIARVIGIFFVFLGVVLGFV